MKRVVIWAALTTLIIGLACAAHASAAAAETIKFGVLDMDRVGSEYRQMQELNSQFQEFQQQQDQQLREKHITRVLTDAEKQEYTDLTTMGAPTDKTTKRVQELMDLSDTREQRVAELRKKTERSAEEEAELKQWTTLYEQRMSELASFQAELQSNRVAKYQELTKLVEDNVRNAAKSIAEAQKLAFVLRREFVLYGGTDITDAVLLKLNGPPAKTPTP